MNIKYKSFYVFFLIFLMFFMYFYCFSLKTVYASDAYVEYKGEITHIFTHCLIAYPDIAFNKKNDMAIHYRRDCITSIDFSDLLNKLYFNNYILINANDTFRKTNIGTIKNKIFLPKNKRPLILSFDDVNYDSKKLGKGMVDKLVINNNKIFSQTKINNKTDISDRLEFVSILEHFVDKHPDFSFKGAKGMINLTGYDGVFGYRTQNNSPNRNTETIKAQNVAALLKRNGWYFASHSYAHAHMKAQSVEAFNIDLQKWDREVANIVGKTSIYVFPYGEWDLFNSDKTKNAKAIALEKFGYSLMCGVGFNRFFGFLPYKKTKQSQILFMDRTPYDGQTLTKRKKELDILLSGS